MKKVSEFFKELEEEKKDKYDEGEYDQEGDMAKSDLRSIIANAQKLHDMIDDADNLPEWVQSKITVAEDYISTVANYMTAEMSEAAKLTPQQKFKNSMKRAGYDMDASAKRLQDLLAKQKKEREEREKKNMAEGDSGAKYKVKSIGKDIKGDYYISPSSDKKVYKSGVNKGDHENPKTGEIKKIVAEDTELQEANAAAIAAATAIAKKKSGNYDSEGMRKTPYKNPDAPNRKTNTERKREMDESYLEEKNVPTNPSLWSRAKALARQKFDVYPSAYANGWASKWYKSKGGSWKSVSESKEDLPFEPDPPKKNKKPDHGPMSRVRHLAKQAMKKQTEKMKPMKETIEESRKAEIVKEIVKKKKNEMNGKFEADPVLTSSVVKENK